MTIRIKKGLEAIGLLRTVEERSGVDLSVCYQCRKCTSGCPVNGFVQNPPSEIIRRLHLGAGNELLDSDLVWMCLSCGTCYARCPMKIDTASVIDTLRTMALERGNARPKGDMPLFNHEFLKTVQRYGRAYDFSAIVNYKLKTMTFTKDLDTFPVMLKKGKMALTIPSGADKKTVKQIFSKAKQNKENTK